MANIVYVATGTVGALNASLELSRRLRDRGHTITYVSPADIGREVAAHGFEARVVTGGGAGGMSYEQSLRNDEIESTVASLDPDVVLVDIESHYAVVVLHELGIPTVLVSPWFSVFRAPDLPPMNTPLLPPASATDRAQIRTAWWRVRASLIRQRIRQSRRRWSSASRPPIAYDTFDYDQLKALARSRGLDIRSIASRSHWLSPYTYTAIPILALVAEELELPHRRSPSLTYGGPMVQRDRSPRGGSNAFDEWLDARRSKDSDRRLAYASLGTYWSADRSLLQQVIEVFERRTDWDLVLGLGGTMSASELGENPDNVLVLEWAPQLEVIRHADVVLTHGGIGTINEALSAGVPVVVYSTGHMDQDGCAVRVAYHGVGTMGAPADTTSDMEQRIASVMQDPDVRRRVDDMAAAFARYEDDGRAVEFVEGFVAER